MKAKVFFLVSGLMTLCLVATYVGTSRASVYAEAYSDSLRTSSIDEYLGEDVLIPKSVCSALGGTISSKLEAHPALGILAELSETFSNTRDEDGGLTQASYEWLRDSTFAETAELQLQDRVGVRSSIMSTLGLDTSAASADMVSSTSENNLRQELGKLKDKNQLPQEVSTASWGSSYERKLAATCGPSVRNAVTESTVNYNSQLLEFSNGVGSLWDNAWLTEGYTVPGSPLVSYKPLSGNCSRVACAKMSIRTPVSCEVAVWVSFSDDNGEHSGFGAETLDTRANISKTLEITGAATGGGTYEIFMTTCS